MNNQLNPPPNVPTGHVHTFIALPYPLPQQAQERLKEAAKTRSVTNINRVEEQLRGLIGFEVTRKTFLPGAA